MEYSCSIETLKSEGMPMVKNSDSPTPGLLERLSRGPIICAEGYLFELERRGYLQAGAYVPEVVLEHPEEVRQLHREFVHAGSDVVEAFTYYAHRDKVRIIDKEEFLEDLNRQALAIAKEVAQESGALLAGNICNTNIYDPQDTDSHQHVRAMFEEQVGWAVEADVDYIIGETFSYASEALLALEVIRETGLPAVITLAVHRAPETREELTPEAACQRLADSGADVVGLNCAPGTGHHAAAVGEDLRRRGRPRRGVAGALSDPRRGTHVSVLAGSGMRLPAIGIAVPDGPRPVHLQPVRDRGLHPEGPGPGGQLFRRLLWRGAPSRSQHGRSPRTHAAGKPVLTRFVEALVSRHRPGPEEAQRGVQREALSRLQAMCA